MTDDTGASTRTSLAATQSTFAGFGVKEVLLTLAAACRVVGIWGAYSGDIYGLDRDNDGIGCE